MRPDVPSFPTVTAIVINWNGRADLEECLPSLEQQTYPSLDVLVVDNGSDDGSAEAVRASGAKWLALGRNIGLAPAMNVGAREASGEVLLFLNNDMRFEPDFVAELVAALESRPDAFAADGLQYDWEGERIVHGRTVLTSRWRGQAVDADMVAQEPAVDADVASQDPPDRVLDCLYASAANILVRRDRLEALGGWDAGYPLGWEDADLGMRAWSRGWTTVFVPSARCFHRVGSSTGKPQVAPFVAFAVMLGANRLAIKFFPWPEVLRTLWGPTRGLARDLAQARWRWARTRAKVMGRTVLDLPGLLTQRRDIRRHAGCSQGNFLRSLERP